LELDPRRRRLEIRVGASGHSQVAITDLGKVPAERLHLKAAYSRCRPSADLRLIELVAMKRPFGQRACFRTTMAIEQQNKKS
jgi:hypothetical protein